MPDPAHLLPHAGGMRLLEEVIDDGEDRLVCGGRVRSGGPLASPDGAPPVVGLEMGAQAGALHQALRSRDGLAPAIGYLVRVRDARFHVARLPVDAPLRVEVRLIAAAPPLLQYEVRVRDGDRVLIEGRLATYAAGQRSTKQNH